MIQFNGAPVVGLGVTRDEEEKSAYAKMLGIPLLGIVAGAVGGGIVGHSFKGGVNTAVGAVVGGVAGGAAGLVVLKVVGDKALEERNATTGVSGFGLGAAEETTPVAQPISPWKEAIVASIVGAATSWAIDGVVRSARRKKRRR